MIGKRAAVCAGMVAIMICVGAEARTKTEAPGNEALAPVIACRALTDAPARLTCYDNSVSALQTAAAKHDVVVIDQQDVARARRSLFGFNLPNFDFLGRGKSDDAHDTIPEDSRLVATIRSAQRGADGNWVFILDDGAVWHQTSGFLAVAPKSNESVEIRRAALGSYFMRVGRQPGFKAKRDS